jgi:hypothetical protein
MTKSMAQVKSIFAYAAISMVAECSFCLAMLVEHGVNSPTLLASYRVGLSSRIPFSLWETEVVGFLNFTVESTLFQRLNAMIYAGRLDGGV